MAIKRMISRDVSEFREFQTRMTGVGRIRIGEYVVPEGKKGRPVKLDRFRLTSFNGDYIHAAAAEYGGTPRQYDPQGGGPKQWEVVTQKDALYVYIVNGQLIDPVYEAWGSGRTCIRRCDGEWNTVMQEPCICNDPERRPADPRQLCKVTTRVNVMLPNVAGLNSWRLETHSENAAVEMAAPNVAGLVRVAPMPVPSMLRLRKEQRRERNHEKHTFETKDFFVPWFDINVVSAAQIAAGPDAIREALTAGGAPAAIGGPEQRAIEARPVSAPVPPTMERPDGLPSGPHAGVAIDDELRGRVLSKIERQTTVEGLEEVKALLRGQGITDKAVIDAWKSKLAAVRAVDDLPTQTGRPYRVLVTGSRTWIDRETINEQLGLALAAHPGRMVLVHGDCPQGADALANSWAMRNGVPVETYPANWDELGKSAGFKRNQAMVDTRPDIVLSFNRGGSNGTEHCTAAAEKAGLKVLRFTDDTPIEREAPERQPVGVPLKEYRVGDTVTVGGIEFTKISNNPFPPGIPEARLFVDTAREMFADVPEQYNEAIRRGATPDAIIEAGGPLHWLATDDQLKDINDQFAADLDDAISGTVEPSGGPVLPDVPDGDYDADELYTSIMTGASKQVPPLTTAEVNSLICRGTGVGLAGHATGLQLARLRAGLKSGVVQWRA